MAKMSSASKLNAVAGMYKQSLADKRTKRQGKLEEQDPQDSQEDNEEMAHEANDADSPSNMADKHRKLKVDQGDMPLKKAKKPAKKMIPND